MPYASNTFDLCFCEWVIEHTSTPLMLLQELQRVLAPGGLLYVSTNNRLWPQEVHAGLWLISWLPHNWAGRLAARFGRCPDPKSWDVWLLTHRQLLSLARRADLQIVGARKDIFASGQRSFAPLLRRAARWGVPIEDFTPNLYLLARKSRNNPKGVLPNP